MVSRSYGERTIQLLNTANGPRFNYYLRVLKAFLVVTDEDNEAKPVAVGTTAGLSIFALAAILVVLGLWPQPLLNLLLTK